MGVVPVRPQARNAVARALFVGDNPSGARRWEDFKGDAEERTEYLRDADDAIQAFLAAEEITRGWRGETFPESRLCGLWRRVDG